MKQTYIILSCLLLTCSEVYAAGWEFYPHATISTIYTDNVELAESGEDSELALEATPGFYLGRHSSRIDTDITYDLQNYFYADESSRNETFHQLDAFFTGELIKETFFIDLDAVNTQHVVDSTGQSAFRNVNVTSNRTDLFSGSISPHLNFDLGDVANLKTRYRYGIVDYDDNRVEVNNISSNEDSRFEEVQVKLGNFDDQVSRIGWQLFYDRDETEYEDTNTEDTFEEYGLNVNYLLLRTLSLLGTVGDEENDFERGLSQSEPEGSFWTAGFNWQPNSRNELEIVYGDRDFGDTWEGFWSRIGRRIDIKLSYNEDLTNETRLQIGQRDLVIQPINTFDNFSVTSEIFERKRGDVELVYKLPRGSIVGNVYTEEREFEFGDEEESDGALVAWLWQFSSKSNLELSAEITDTENREGTDTEDTDFTAELGTRFSRLISGFVEVGRSEQESSGNGADYDEHFARVGVRLGQFQ